MSTLKHWLALSPPDRAAAIARFLPFPWRAYAVLGWVCGPVGLIALMAGAVNQNLETQLYGFSLLLTLVICIVLGSHKYEQTKTPKQETGK